MFLDIVIDILLVAIIVFGAIVGIKKGFVSIAAKPVKFVAAISLAFLICVGVADLIVTPIIEAPIANYVSQFIYDNCENITAANAADELPTLLKISAAIFDINVRDITEGAGNAVLDVIVENLTAPVIKIVSIIIAFFLVFILASIAFSLLISLINRLFSNGILGVFNRVVGLVVTGSVALIATWALAAFFGFLIHLPAFEEVEFLANFKGGVFYNFFNTYSPIELLLSF